jgi:gas vesicle protein
MKEELEKLDKKEGSLLVPFVVGGLVGAGVALLLAPKSGRELRKDIKDIASNTRDKVVTTVEQGKELYEGSKAAVMNAIEAGKIAYTEEKEKHLKAA